MNKCSSKRSKTQVAQERKRQWYAPLDIGEAMEQHEGLVHAFIRKQGGGEIEFKEALHAGRIGLWRAIRGYDDKRGTAFATYAWIIICRHINNRAKELQRERKEGKDIFPMRSAVDPGEKLEQRLVKEALRELVEKMPERLRRVIVCRYGLGEQEPCKLEQIGVELGVSKERVRQLQQEALAWLRHPAHSSDLRQQAGKNTAADYRQALAQNAALRRAQRGQQ